MTKLLVAVLGAIVVIYLAARDWRRSIKAVLLLVVLEGALRKWILPQANELIYFLKDFIILGAYLRYFLSDRERRPIYLDVVSGALLLVFCWNLYEVFNPDLGSPILGIFGFRNYLIYVPMMWMLPSLFQTVQELQVYIRNYLTSIIPVGLLGIVQYVSPKTSWINAYVPNEGANEAIATFGSAGLQTVRITGTFSYLNTYQSYLIVCFALLLPMLTLKQPQKWRWLTIVELLLLIVNTMMTGSRTAFLSQGLILGGYLVLGFVTQSSKMSFWLQRGLPSMGIVGLGVLLGFRDAVDRFWKRASYSRGLGTRITQNFQLPPGFLSGNNLDGYGIGANHGARVTLQNLLGLPPGKLPPPAEPEIARVALELGPLGLILWYGFRIVLISSLWFTIWRVKHPFLHQLAIVGFLTHIVMLSGQMVFNHTFAVYYWFMGGFIFLLPHLEAVETWRHNQVLLMQANAQANPQTYIPSAPYRQS